MSRSFFSVSLCLGGSPLPCEREDSVGKACAVLSVCLLVLAPIALGGPQEGGSAKTHVLKPTPKTVVWGYFDPASKPALTIKSGETVEVQTLLAGTPETLQRGLLPPEEVEPALREIVTLVKDKGPG